MTRYVSFRFDDGFFVGALKANVLLAPNHGSFFIVTGLAQGSHKLEHIPEFVGREFGTLESWRLLSRAGHDIQPHSITHPKLPTLTRQEQIAEIRGSLSFVRKIHEGPYIFCFPYNERIELDFADLGFAAVGFVGSRHSVFYNDLSAIDLCLLRSNVVPEERFDWLVDQLRTEIPDNAWVILGFHSFDGEGARPWSVNRFAQLVSEIRSLEFQIETIAEIVRRYR